eukprot:TRINITY_DN19138_c0_g1_i1.p1 TRINITY_DN19138_c0_g1~~TRINITY_DN19138_c0_g1_i1.p1  ORF type:complete len:283 (-),score=32.53 TRINITY_DN19138_c0_g1_i1:196-1044(-)
MAAVSSTMSRIAVTDSVICTPSSSVQVNSLRAFLPVKPVSARRSLGVRASAEVQSADASSDSIAPEVAALPDAGDTEGVQAKGGKKLSPLEKGGTLKGKQAAGKDPSLATLGKPVVRAEGKFSDPRWKDGTWDISKFTVDGKVDWDAVIDAEVVRRQWLEENPQSSNNDDPVVFDTSQVPWWAWVRRFHLPEAEKLNGRAAMVGYFMALVVDSATGVGLVDQQSSFLGKLLLFATVVGVLLIRKNEDVQEIKNIAEEWTFYDKQWQATWKEGPPPANRESNE